MTTLSESVIGKIKSEHISPVPRWHFLLKNYVFWGLLVLSILLGSMAFSVIVHIYSLGDFDLLAHLGGGILVSSIMLLPFFWLISLGVFALVAYFNWKHTRRAYRFKRRWIFLGGFASSVILGSFFYTQGLGGYIDLLMAHAVPYYNQSKHQARIQLWQQPQKGLIIGRILDLQDEGNEFTIEDGSGNTWEVGNDVQNKTKSEVKKIVQKGAIVKIVGQEKGSKGFVAKDIRQCKDCDGDDDDYGSGGSDNDADNDSGTGNYDRSNNNSNNNSGASNNK